MSKIKDTAAQMKLDSPIMAATSAQLRNEALQAVREALTAHKEEIFSANRLDMQAAEETGVAPAIIKRLKFDEHKLADVIQGITDLIGLPDPTGRILLNRELDEGLRLVRETCPIGVIGVIFEARPDALVQISTLCMKSGNCALLKGGSETLHTNKTLFSIIHEAASGAGLPADCLYQIEAREEIRELLECDRYVDLLIPRGSNAFVQYIMNHTRIPVMGHADGICHIYVDKDADIDKILPAVVDAKVQYTAACNAAETLLVHRAIAEKFLPRLKEAYDAQHVTIRGTEEVQKIISCDPASEEDFSTEYLSLMISVRLVDDADEAIRHINRYGSHHTDAIMTENSETAARFMQLVDSAGVYQNCSTRFADGYRYGFGAEVGISTSKLHARGPVGLEGLVTYKYKLFGSGQTVDAYATGKKHFHFKDL
ncbi:MAG: glutamate-5-semialdehyde dehydrogenase [Eubacterium sp.]|jgi:glutamate-5-semialdehyde dehydrogenase